MREKPKNEREFNIEYLNPPRMPNTLLEWIEDLIVQLECTPPEPCLDEMLYAKRVGAWETQQLIIQKLKYAVKCEKAFHIK